MVTAQLIDLTADRAVSYFDRGAAVQIAAADPFDPALCDLASELLHDRRVRLRDFGTAIVSNGPRLRTAAENRLFATTGGDLSNMTLMPETVLALELGIAVVNISFITDRAVGTAVDHGGVAGIEQIRRKIQQAESTFQEAVAEFVRRLPVGFSHPSPVPQEAIDEVLAPRSDVPVSMNDEGAEFCAIRRRRLPPRRTRLQA